tara:strand:+ start:1823 stop:2521 length:699 start_codon:yes stop_codon:yes gene_type:complete
MPSTATLATLRARALDYADMTDSNFPNADRVDDYINSAASEMYDILVNAYEDYFLTTNTITLVSGTEDYALPSDFYKAKRVYYVSGGRRFAIDRFNLDDLSGAKTGPLSTGSAELWYVPEMTFMDTAGPTDTVGEIIPPMVNGWADFLAISAAIKLLIREESDPSALMREKEVLKQRMISMAEPRDAGLPDTIQDTSRRWADIGYAFDPGAFTLRYRIMGGNIKFVQYDAGY